jgi:hypothetical protein
VVSTEVSPDTVSTTVTGEPGYAVPDEGVTASDPSREDGSEIDQVTGPPFAVSVSVPPSSGLSSTVVGFTVSVPVTGGALMVTIVEGAAVGDVVDVAAGEPFAGDEADAEPAPPGDGVARVRPALGDALVTDRLSCPGGVRSPAGGAGGADGAAPCAGAEVTPAVPGEEGGRWWP